jgi:pimeloyl-ACP methyl ester carboxylesterase
MTTRASRQDHVRASDISGTSGTSHTFRTGGHDLAYETWGEGDLVFVLLHGMLMDARLNRGVARRLAARGHRVVLLDLLGHGESDKPRDPAAYRMDVYREQVVALLDHLDVGPAVLGGVSLGANVSLQVAVHHPDRVRGLVLEAPVLERAVPAAALTFAPALLGLWFAAPIARLVSKLARRARHTGSDLVDGALAPLALPPEVTMAILHGVMVGPVAPTLEERRRIRVPALVLGHRGGFIHPFSDAAHLAAELPGGRLLPTWTLLELRVWPGRLLREIGRFLDTLPRNPDGLIQAV